MKWTVNLKRKLKSNRSCTAADLETSVSQIKNTSNMIIWVNLFQNYMFIVFSYCTFSSILKSMEINSDISIDEVTMIEPHALSEFLYTAISRKVVGQSVRDNPERYCGLFLSSLFFKEV